MTRLVIVLLLVAGAGAPARAADPGPEGPSCDQICSKQQLMQECVVRRGKPQPECEKGLRSMQMKCKLTCSGGKTGIKWLKKKVDQSKAAKDCAAKCAKDDDDCRAACKKNGAAPKKAQKGA